MKTQQRVELRYSHSDPKPRGTVSRVAWNGDFRVSFDPIRDADGNFLRTKHGHLIRGGRYDYKAAQSTAFTVIS